MAAQENSRLPEVPLLLDNASLATVADLVRFYLPSRELVRLQVRTTAYHRLPDLDFLSNCQVKILASASGLLLLLTRNWPGEPPLGRSIIVCNPLTKKWRHLPQVDENTCSAILINPPAYRTTERKRGVSIYIVVDDVSSADEVVLIERLSIYTYKSQTNQWSSTSLQISPDRWAALHIGSICSNGRIYTMAEIEGEEERHDIVIRSFFRVESRRWLLDAVYTLNARCVFGERRPRGPILVACLDDVYAVVPVIENLKGRPSGPRRRRRRLFIDSPVTGTVRFEVFLLLEEKFAFCATLPLQVELRIGFQEWASFGLNPCSWYRCAAQGTVIWLACQNQLLQFDVVTQCCKTETVQSGSVSGEFDFCVPPYEPNFRVTP